MARDDEEKRKRKGGDTVVVSVGFSATRERKRGGRSRLISKRDERKSGRQATASGKNSETLTNQRVDSPFSLSVDLSSPRVEASRRFSVSSLFVVSSREETAAPVRGRQLHSFGRTIAVGAGRGRLEAARVTARL